jgi:general secretion pathway protein D
MGDIKQTIIHKALRSCRACAQPILSVVVCVSLLVLASSCNTPALEQDAKNTYHKAKEIAEDGIDQAQRKLDQTFDPETNDLIDPQAGLSRKDYEDFFLKRSSPVVEDRPQTPVLPDVSQLLVAPRPPVLGQDKLVTLSVTEDVPLKEVLLELSRRADIDIELDPGITGGVIFRAKDKPFSEVIERIAALTGLRYSVKNGVLKIKRDLPYMVNYKVDLLNQTRSNSGSVSVSTQVLSAVSSEGGGGGGADAFTSGSSTNLTTETDGDLWAAMTEGLTNIITSYSGQATSVSGGAGNTVDSGADGALGVAGKKITSGSTPSGDTAGVLSINKQSGVITILASQRQHKAIKEYIDTVLESVAAQVLIEAKVVEVTLDKRYRSGIRWDLISNRWFDFNAGGTFTDAVGDTGNQFFQIAALPTEILGFDGITLETVVTMVEDFGVTRTLSSPRINATNNQQAILTFAENFVYFDLEVQEESVGTGDNQEETLRIDSEVRTVPIGVILALQPSIDLEKGEIVMNIRPTLSRVTSTVSDPQVSFLAARTNSEVTSQVPVVEVREIDSILRIKSGQVMVIGGLMEERVTNKDVGVPGLQDIPYLGNAFKSVDKSTEVIETVIFIKATIIPPYGVGRADKELYRKFPSDPRPLTF